MKVAPLIKGKKVWFYLTNKLHNCSSMNIYEQLNIPVTLMVFIEVLRGGSVSVSYQREISFETGP